MYLQSIHLTRLLSRLITVKPQQSEWLNTKLFSAECGSTLHSSRVATTNLILYPTIIPGVSANLMTSCSVQTKRTYRQHMEMSLFIYQFLSIQSSIMNSSSVVCKQCLLNISTIYLASRPISKYPYPNI